MQQVGLGGALKNDMWITEDDAPDPSPLPTLPGFHVLVRPVSVKGITKGGILLPDSTKEDMSYLTTIGKVLSLGDLAYGDRDKFPKGGWCKEGDYVCYGKHTGDKFLYKGVRLIICYDDEITMVVKDPSSLDPMFNLSNQA